MGLNYTFKRCYCVHLFIVLPLCGKDSAQMMWLYEKVSVRNTGTKLTVYIHVHLFKSPNPYPNLFFLPEVEQDDFLHPESHDILLLSYMYERRINQSFYLSTSCIHLWKKAFMSDWISDKSRMFCRLLVFVGDITIYVDVSARWSQDRKDKLLGS